MKSMTFKDLLQMKLKDNVAEVFVDKYNIPITKAKLKIKKLKTHLNHCHSHNKIQ